MVDAGLEVIDGQQVVDSVKSGHPIEIAKALQLDLSSSAISEAERIQSAQVCIKHPNI